MNTIAMYFLFLIKLISTVMFLYGDQVLKLLSVSYTGGFLFLLPTTFVSYIYTFALSFDPQYLSIAFVVNVIAILISLLCVMCIVLGIISKRARKVSKFLIILIMLLDFSVSFFIGWIVLKIICILVSGAMLILCFVKK
jgi:hypothetical protein